MTVLLSGVTLGLLVLGRPVFGGSLKDIEHVVIFMQENRSWDCVCAISLQSNMLIRQYFGTMAGVRGFNDPNVQVNADGLPVWFQYVLR